MIRLVLYALLAYVSYQLFKLLARRLFPSNVPDGDGTTGNQNTDLIQDPQCGTYFLKQRGVTATVQGKRLYFCSESCRDGYLARHRNG